MRSRVVVLLLSLLGLLGTMSSALAAIQITTLSARADSVSGGDVLVQISYPAGQLLPLWVTLNGNDVTGKFRPGAQANTWMGLVTGLSLGANTLRVRSKSP